MRLQSAWSPFVCLAFVIGLAACTADTDPAPLPSGELPMDAIAGVQETNVRVSTPSCDEFAYGEMVTRSCDSEIVGVRICSPEELCAEQVAALVTSVAACEEARLEFVWTPPSADNCTE